MCSYPCSYSVSRLNKPMSYHPFGINSDNTTNGPMGKYYDKNIRNDFYVYACHSLMMLLQATFLLLINTMDLQNTKLTRKN